MKDPREVIIRPVITEHSYDQMEGNTFTSEARSLPAGQDPHLEEGHGHAQGRRHHRAVRVSDVSTCCLGAPAIAGAPFLLEEGAKSEPRRLL